MIPGNIPLAFCTILVRRLFDSCTGALPAAAITNSLLPVPVTAAVLSGALIGLYHHLRKGTLVKIGIGRKVSHLFRNSRSTIQRRVPLNSWFLRNARACRSKCTEAMRHLARQSAESLGPGVSSMPEIAGSSKERNTFNRLGKEPPIMDVFNRDESGNETDVSIYEDTLPVRINRFGKRRKISRNSSVAVTRTNKSNNARTSENDLTRENGSNCSVSNRSKRRSTNSDNNERFSEIGTSCVDLTVEDGNRGPTEIKEEDGGNNFLAFCPVNHRPITRHFFRRHSVGKDIVQEDARNRSRAEVKNRKKSLSLPRITNTTVEIPVVIRTQPAYHRNFRRSARRYPLNKSRITSNHKNQSGDQQGHKMSKMKLGNIEPPQVIQKVTRKTRSGRIYAYRV